MKFWTCASVLGSQLNQKLMGFFSISEGNVQQKIKNIQNDKKKSFFFLGFNRIAVACKNCVGQQKTLLFVVALPSKLSSGHAFQPHPAPKSPETVPPSLKLQPH